jgi:hypothetical protein
MTGLEVISGETPFEYARRCVALFRDEPIRLFGAEANMLTKADNRVVVREIIKADALSHPTRMMATVDDARAGWDLSDEALRELIIEFIDRGEPLPTYLASYNMDVARGFAPRVKGQQRADRIFRNLALAVIVLLLMEKFEIRPTGRGPVGGTSACSIVARAWNKEMKVPALQYKAIETIWSEIGPRILP